jgi:formylglycine-generating enzyme required for sulfatase activity
MGCSEDDGQCRDHENPLHIVRLTRGFWLGQTPVTQAAYEKVIGADPSTFKGQQLPVETVNWREASKYCEAVGGRLPTEAEWEYAARAGSQQAYYGELDKIAWYYANSDGKTHQVGQKQANPWGLYDILGNVWEWVADWFQEDYYRSLSSPAIDPKGPPSGEMRVLRGGAWNYSAGYLRVSSRAGIQTEGRGYNVGFRCVRGVIPL